MNQSSLPTRLREYINALLPSAHGHQIKATTDFVMAIITVQSCAQATIARFFESTEAALKRLSRFLHNERLEVEALALSHARLLLAQLPALGPLRLSIDWTIEDTQHLLVASVAVGRRAIPLFWRAYPESQLKDRRSALEREFIRYLFQDVLAAIDRKRLILTADRAFADVELCDVLDFWGISFIIRSKDNVKVMVDGRWAKLKGLRWYGNQRRRRWGRLWYCETDPRRLYLVQSRARNRTGHWETWHLISNRPLSASRASAEYARRFTCEEGFRDSKRMLGFASARIADISAWQRMFTLVAIALLVLTAVGCQLSKNHQLADQLLRRVKSRRRTRSELSLVRAIVELLNKQMSLWELLCCSHKLNLEAKL
jgi:Transposase DDE domain